MSANRKVHRNAWRSDQRAQFKSRPEPRIGFQEWRLKTFHRSVYDALIERMDAARLKKLVEAREALLGVQGAKPPVKQDLKRELFARRRDDDTLSPATARRTRERAVLDAAWAASLDADKERRHEP